MSLYLGEEKIQNISVGLQNAGLDITGLNNETTTSLNGIIKGENGKVTTAVPGTDYLAPDALNNLGSLANKSKVSESDLDDALKQTIQDAGNIQLPEGIVQNNIVNTFTADGKITMADGYVPNNDGDLVNKKYLDQQVKSALPAFSNGPLLYDANGTFNPTTYNLKAGDQIQVICIGGGAGGKNGTAAGNNTNKVGDYGCGGNGSSSSSREKDEDLDAYYWGASGGGGSGYLTKKLVTLDSTASISVTIGAGGKASSSGGTTSFGGYLTAEGGRTGTSGGSGYSWSDATTGSGGAGGHPGSGQSGGAGWTVKSYIIQDTSGSLGKGSGAVFIWY